MYKRQDGTLLDTSPDFLIATNLLLQRHQKPKITQQQLAPYITNGSAEIIEQVFQVARESESFNALWTELLTLYSEHIADETHYYSGMEEVIKYIENNKLLWGIVTNKPSTYSLPLLEQLNISVNCCICPDHVSNAKPSPEGLLLACKQLHIKPSEAIFVGDHKRDIDAAKAANMRCIAAAYGFIMEGDFPSNWGADHLINNPVEIIPILKGS